MNNRTETDPVLVKQVREIKEHLMTLDKDALIDARAAIESAIIGVDVRSLPDFLRGKSREAIIRARMEVMETFRTSQK